MRVSRNRFLISPAALEKTRLGIVKRFLDAVIGKTRIIAADEQSAAACGVAGVIEKDAADNTIERLDSQHRYLVVMRTLRVRRPKRPTNVFRIGLAAADREIALTDSEVQPSRIAVFPGDGCRAGHDHDRPVNIFMIDPAMPIDVLGADTRTAMGMRPAAH